MSIKEDFEFFEQSVGTTSPDADSPRFHQAVENIIKFMRAELDVREKYDVNRAMNVLREESRLSKLSPVTVDALNILMKAAEVREQSIEENFCFMVYVKARSKEQAKQVILERIAHDEDYGFEYTIGYDEVDIDEINAAADALEENWESGDLAGAVNGAAAILRELIS